MPILDQFLTSLTSFLLAKDAQQLQLFLRVEPPLPEQFEQLKRELKSRYQDGKILEAHIDRLIPIDDDARTDQPWPGFQSFVKLYLEYWRDVDFNDLLGTYRRLNLVTR